MTSSALNPHQEKKGAFMTVLMTEVMQIIVLYMSRHIKQSSCDQNPRSAATPITIQDPPTALSGTIQKGTRTRLKIGHFHL